jgi:acyl-CoA thioesterase-2
MGDLAADTAVERVDDGRYVGRLSDDWEIWGPMGGYVAAVAVRAAGAESPFDRPASFACQYLGVAAFEPVDVTVAPTRIGRSAAAQRVSVRQGDRAILEAMVWSVPATDGLDHDVAVAPDVAGPDDLPSAEELARGQAPPFRFWENFESRPLSWVDPWPPSEPMAPEWRNWLRFRSWPDDADPWLEAARLVLLADLPSWPSAHRPHAWREPPFIAPTLDLHVVLHRLAPDEAWVLLEGTSPVAADGLIGFTSRLWSTSGRLLASGNGQTLCRRVAG